MSLNFYPTKVACPAVEPTQTHFMEINELPPMIWSFLTQTARIGPPHSKLYYNNNIQKHQFSNNSWIG